MDPVTLCAHTTADWHASWLTALGLRWERPGSVWRALDSPPFIYWTTITLGADASASEIRDAHGTVCDSWSAFDLEPFDFVERAREPWFLRPPGEVPAAEAPSELEIVRVSTPAQVAEFEALSLRGFGGEDASVEVGAFHPPSILGTSE